MANSEIFTIRMTDTRAAQIAALETRTGLQGPAAVIDFALATTLAHYGAQEVAMEDKRVFQRSEYDPNWRDSGDDWTVDLSTGDMANPDCYWHFNLKREAREFLALVDGGTEPAQAYGDVTGHYAR